VKAAQRYVLDDASTAMATRLAGCMPRQLAKLIALAKPASTETWIEWPTSVMMQTRDALYPGWREQAGVEPRRVDPEARIGVLVNLEGEAMHLHCVETPGHKHAPVMWAIGYMIGAGLEGTGDDEARMGWGYAESVDVSALRGSIMVTIHPFSSRIADGERREALAMMIRELSGLTRITMSALAMLNSVASIEEATRPAGRHVISGGSTAPFLSRRMVTLALPRTVRDPLAHVIRVGEARRKRLHEVRAHWRHYTRPPLNSLRGAERIETLDGRILWRVPVEKHLRGDPDIGVIDHAGVAVRGRQSNEGTTHGQT